jgi:type IV secretory pathway VirB6-like protein
MTTLTRRVLRVLLPLCFCATLMHAQAPGACTVPAGVSSVGGGALDMVSWVTTAILDLVDGYVDLFVNDGMILAKLVGIYLLMVRGATYMLRAQSTHWPMTPLDELGIFIGKFLAVLGMLHYYNTPLPGVSFSFHQIFTTTATSMSHLINTDVFTDFMSKIQCLSQNLEKPSFTDLSGIVLYYIVLGSLALIEGVLFFVICFGFVAAGLGSLLGPLFIPFYMWPTQAARFFRWIDYMVVYAFYQVVATGVIAIWASVLVHFIDNALHGSYDLAHLAILFVAFGGLNVTIVLSLTRVPAMAGELFGSGGSVGAQVANSLQNAVRTAVVAAAAS